MNPDGLGAVPLVGAWVEHADTGGHDSIDAAIEANVVAQLRNLRSYDFIAEAEAAGTLSLQGWVYDIGSGVVRLHDGERFVDYVAIAGASS
jgi:carbonic anhydrase